MDCTGNIMTNNENRIHDRLISSIDIISKTGISRATLNNYIKFRLLPKPIVKKPEETNVRARMVGYFPETVIDIIEQIKYLKKEGCSMEEIVGRSKSLDINLIPGDKMVRAESESGNFTREKESPPFKVKEPHSTEASADVIKPLNLTINDISCPAYLLNNSFEIDWINDAAENKLFHQNIHTIKEPSGRSIFPLLMRKGYENKDIKDSLVDFHLSFVREKIQKNDLKDLYEGITQNEIEELEKRYDHIEIHPRQAVNKVLLKLCDPMGNRISDSVYYMVFREGTLFIHTPLDNSVQGIADLLSSRSRVINDLLRQRMPTLVSFCVLVADLQNSVRICAELPPEEYFELINQIWTCVEGSFKQYYGTYGKHTGDGMLYYFLKERDNRYMINAVSCALEIREKIKKLSMEWKIRKGWFNDLYLNIGINEGLEYFGTIPSAPNIEFTALGDSVNYAGRLSDFARYGAIWTTKNLINKLTMEEKADLRYGVRRKDQDREIFIENSFSRIIDLINQEDIKTSKFIDIATLAATEIMGHR